MTQQALNFIGLHAYSIGFDLISLAIFAAAACLIDECYRRGPKKLQKELQKYFDTEREQDGEPVSQPVSGVSTSSSTTVDSTSAAPIVMSGSMRRCANA
jgi:hypothetical protein